MKTTTLSILGAAFLVTAVSAFGCGDDESAATTTAATTGGPVSTAANTTASTSASTGSGMGGQAGAGGAAGGAGGGSAAQAFCMTYQTNCGFGMTGRFADLAACVAAFEAATTACQGCWTTHVANQPANTHCPHACGAPGSPGACADCGNSCM